MRVTCRVLRTAGRSLSVGDTRGPLVTQSYRINSFLFTNKRKIQNHSLMLHSLGKKDVLFLMLWNVSQTRSLISWDISFADPQKNGKCL